MAPVKHWVTCGFQQSHQNYHQVVVWNLWWNKLSLYCQVKICNVYAPLGLCYIGKICSMEMPTTVDNFCSCLVFLGWQNIHKIVCFCFCQSRQAKASVHGKSIRKQLVLQVFIHILAKTINNINITWMIV